MNVLFLSPHYPPPYWLFCRALRARGATVLGLGDAPPQALAPGLASALTDYVHVPEMSRYDDMLRAVALLVHRHGRLDVIDSLNEHWLDVEAKLREDFNVPGLRPRETQHYRSKSGMAEVLAAHHVAGPTGVLVRSRRDIEAFASAYGFPLFFKPDIGVGAEGAFRVDSEQALSPLLESPPVGFVLQRFIEGRTTTFDGLTDRDGRVVFATSLIYADPIAEIVRDRREVYFYTRRELPPALADLGERVVRAFHLRSRLFHVEFFERPDGSFLPLEINLRPPGGFSVDLMNYACDADLYDLWARVITNDDVSDHRPEARYHAAHVGRRPARYRVAHHEVASRLGPALLAAPPVPPGLRLMGDPIYLLRHADEAELHRLARGLLERA